MRFYFTIITPEKDCEVETCVFESETVEKISPYLTAIDNKLLFPELTLISGCLYRSRLVVVNFLVLQVILHRVRNSNAAVATRSVRMKM